MDLFELIEEIDSTKSDIQYYNDEKERLETKVGVKATDYSKEPVKGGSGNSREDALLQLAQMEMNIEDAIQKLDNLTRQADRKYSIFKNHKDEEKQIYIEKKLKRWSNAKISTKHGGLGTSTIYRIIEKIEKNCSFGKKWESK